jgi:hypothetical protein
MGPVSARTVWDSGSASTFVDRSGVYSNNVKFDIAGVMLTVDDPPRGQPRQEPSGGPQET